jgi:hypothetical protein
MGSHLGLNICSIQIPKKNVGQSYFLKTSNMPSRDWNTKRQSSCTNFLIYKINDIYNIKYRNKYKT